MTSKADDLFTPAVDKSATNLDKRKGGLKDRPSVYSIQLVTDC
jgi:hypothetical protein